MVTPPLQAETRAGGLRLLGWVYSDNFNTLSALEFRGSPLGLEWEPLP